MFKKESGSLQKFQSLDNNREVSVKVQTSPSLDKSEKLEMMNQAWQNAMAALKKASEDGVRYLIIKHDKAPFKRGYVTVGSRVRHLMRSHAADPYIYRSQSIQLESAFIAAIRPRNQH